MLCYQVSIRLLLQQKKGWLNLQLAWKNWIGLASSSLCLKNRDWLAPAQSEGGDWPQPVPGRSWDYHLQPVPEALVWPFSLCLD
jgi:hypothetical protein